MLLGRGKEPTVMNKRMAKGRQAKGITLGSGPSTKPRGKGPETAAY